MSCRSHATTWVAVSRLIGTHLNADANWRAILWLTKDEIEELFHEIFFIISIAFVIVCLVYCYGLSISACNREGAISQFENEHNVIMTVATYLSIFEISY